MKWGEVGWGDWLQVPLHFRESSVDMAWGWGVGQAGRGPGPQGAPAGMDTWRVWRDWGAGAGLGLGGCGGEGRQEAARVMPRGDPIRPWASQGPWSTCWAVQQLPAEAGLPPQ